MGRRMGENLGKLGDLGSNLKALRNMKQELEKEDDKIVEAERWGTLNSISDKIVSACEERDLGALASAARDLKNRLRRPAIRKALAEAEEKKGPAGKCRCAGCKAIIDGSVEPCVEGALCTKCALKNKTVSPASKAEKAARKSAAKTGTPPPASQSQSQQDDGRGDEKEESVGIGLRRRGYTQ